MERRVTQPKQLPDQGGLRRHSGLATGLFVRVLTAVTLSASAIVWAADSVSSPLTLSSHAFKDGGWIPDEYTCYGNNSSPPLSWRGVPSGTQSLMLIMVDPDAPDGAFSHWMLSGLQRQVSYLEAAQTNFNFTVDIGKNGWGHAKYEGPCPTSGVHHYRFILMALSTPITLPKDYSLEDALRASRDYRLGTAVLTGRVAHQEKKGHSAKPSGRLYDDPNPQPSA